MTKMKRVSAAALSCLIAFGAAGCSGKNQNSSLSDAEPLNVTQVMYKEERVSVSEDVLSAYNMRYIEETNKVRCISRTADGKFAMTDLDAELSEGEQKILIDEENVCDLYPYIGSDGSLLLFVEYAEYDGKYSPETDAEEYYKSAKLSFKVKRFDKNGILAETVPVTGLAENFRPDTLIIQGFVPYGDNGWILDLLDNAVLIGRDGTAGELRPDCANMDFGIDRNGDVIAMGMDGYCILDGKTMKLPAELTAYPEYVSPSHGLIPGIGKHDGFALMQDGIYSYRKGEELVQLLSYSKSGIDGSSKYFFAAMGEDTFLVIGSNENGRTMTKLTVRPDDYTESKKAVVVGAISTNDSNMTELVYEYNKSNDEYKAELKAYPDDDSLRSAVLSDEAPDVYCGFSFDTVRKFANIGAFADIYQLAAEDTEGDFSVTDFLDNYISALEYKGGLYGMGTMFGLSVCIADKDTTGESFAKWSVDDYLSHAENMPENMYFSSPTGFENKEQVFEYFCISNLNQWIDFNKTECRFDTDEFIRVLNFCRDVKLPPEFDWNEFYNNSTEDEQKIKGEEMMLVLKNRTSMVMPTYIHSLQEFGREIDARGLDLDTVSFVTMPSDRHECSFSSVNSIYSVLSNGSCPEGGWDFFKFTTEEMPELNDWQPCLSVKKSVFEKQIADTLKDAETMNAANNSSNYSGYEFIPTPPNEQHAELLREIIESCTAITGTYPDICSILTEEFESFCAGETTAEQCAEMMQSRVSIYLSEND